MHMNMAMQDAPRGCIRMSLIDACLMHATRILHASHVDMQFDGEA